MTAASDRIRVLFVCLGNICRSPMAEAVFRKLVRDDGLERRFEIDSAGVGSWHTGEPPDERAVATAAGRGVLLTGSARQVRAADLDRFDYILAMDEENLAALRRLARTGARTRGATGKDAGAESGTGRLAASDAAQPSSAAGPVDVTRAGGRVDPTPRLPEIRLFREFDPASVRAEDLDVPDPYYGGPRGFDDVYDLVERAARGLLDHIRREHGL